MSALDCNEFSNCRPFPASGSVQDSSRCSNVLRSQGAGIDPFCCPCRKAGGGHQGLKPKNTLFSQEHAREGGKRRLASGNPFSKKPRC